MENNELRAKLAKKITTISDKIGKMEKDGKNTHSNYGFISYEKLNAALRNVLDECGLAIIPSVVSYDEKWFIQRDKDAIRTIVVMEFLLVDAETGYCEKRQFTGADQDLGGKSMGQAITECQKRFEFKLFHISSQDDVVCDPDSKTTDTGKRRPTPLNKQQEPQPKKEQWSSISMLLFEKDTPELDGEQKKQMSETIKSYGFLPGTLTESQANIVITELQK